MILNEIIFYKNGHSLRVVQLALQRVIIVEKDGKIILEIESELASLVGDCLRHIGCETDFLGIRSHME
jgi:hypothetical protein